MRPVGRLYFYANVFCNRVYRCRGNRQHLQQLFSVLFGIIRVAGVVLLVFGIYQIFQSSHAQDATGRIQGVFMLGGGLVAVFLREILGFLGIAV